MAIKKACVFADVYSVFTTITTKIFLSGDNLNSKLQFIHLTFTFFTFHPDKFKHFKKVVFVFVLFVWHRHGWLIEFFSPLVFSKNSSFENFVFSMIISYRTHRISGKTKESKIGSQIYWEPIEKKIDKEIS